MIRLNITLSMALIMTVLAGVGIPASGQNSISTAYAQSDVSLIFLKDGDLWQWNGSVVTQLTTWGYNERPVLSPDGSRIAYNSWAILVVEAIAQGKQVAGFIPSNIWLLDPVNGNATRAADQPADASFWQDGVTDKVIMRGDPAWSPDSSQIAWAELVLPETQYRLVTYNVVNGAQTVIVPQLPYPWADGGFFDIPDVTWGSQGIAVDVVAANAVTGDFEEHLYLYTPTGSLVHDSVIGGSATEWPFTKAWTTYNGAAYFGLTYPSGKRYVLDPATGDQQPMSAIPELYSVATPSGSISAFVAPNSDAAGNIDKYWTVTYPDRTQTQALEFSGTPESIAIAPDGQALAYVSDAVYVWSNGSVTAIPGTQGIGSSWGVGVVWGANDWRIRADSIPAGSGGASGLGGGIACSPAPRLTLGTAGQVLPGLPNVIRTQPRRGSDSVIIGEIPGGGVFGVENGPVCGPEGRYWWQVDYQGIKGWTAEGQSGVYWLQPYQAVTPTPSCSMTPRLTIGSTAYVTPGLPNVIRTQPRRGTDSPIIGWIPGNGVFRVLAGPQCGPEGRYWWQVEYAGITGWTAEGQNGIYWTAPFGCPASPAPRLAPWMQARITPGLPNTLRNAPSASAAAIGQIPAGGVFTVLSGPQCGPEGWSYWRVQYGNQIGWTAEGGNGAYWIEPLGYNTPLPTPTPTAICSLTPRLGIGGLGRVLPGDANVLRSAPGTGSDSVVTGSIPGGGQFTVLNGPQCGNDGRYWWQVQYGGQIGWTAEGEGLTYWVEPLF
ncbi:MAG: SH3 domain-containing protein [Anaerolineae bacterium]|nr:SH3 domain-containing protein [Anaerolineae bacterium]